MVIPCDTIGAALAGYLDAGDITPPAIPSTSAAS
jgi:hypothetical protein